MALGEWVERVIAEVREEDIERGRSEYHARTGSFEPGEPFYEERINAFFDYLLIDWQSGALLARRVRDPLARALLRSMRSLYRADVGTGGIGATSLLSNAVFRIAPVGVATRLTDGDIFDGRAVGLPDGTIELAPGPVFHPRETHDALLALLAQAERHGRKNGSILDPLLRIRMRFDRFTNMQARHVYRFDALDRKEILAASWVR